MYGWIIIIANLYLLDFGNVTMQAEETLGLSNLQLQILFLSFCFLRMHTSEKESDFYSFIEWLKLKS